MMADEMKNDELGAKITAWLLHGRVGLSSKVMATVALGGDPGRPDHPHDPSDFNRCLLLLKAAPGVRGAFPQISALSPEWKLVITWWDEINKSFVAEVGEDWSKGESAPKTYAMMQRLLAAREEGGAPDA